MEPYGAFMEPYGALLTLPGPRLPSGYPMGSLEFPQTTFKCSDEGRLPGTLRA